MNRNEYKQALGTAITALAEAFRQKISPALLLAYEIGLDDLAIANVQEAVRLAIRQCRFMPTVAELRELIGSSESNDSRADLAWSCVLSAMRGIGRYRSVSFVDDPLTNAVLRSLGGWVAVCDRCNDERDADKWVRKDFCECYRRLQNAAVPLEMCRALVGAHDAHNLTHARDWVRQPVLARTGLPLLPRMGEHARIASERLALPLLPNSVGYLPQAVN